VFDPALVIEVWAPGDHGGLVGSGCLVGDGLVLSAAHVVDVAGGDLCDVRALGEAEWSPSKVIWRGGRGCDAALLRVHAPASSLRLARPLRLGRLTGPDHVRVRALGFPDAQGRPDGIRDTEELQGEIVPLTAHKSGLLTVSIDGSVPAAVDGRCLWQGMSGAGLFCSDLLVGVVIIAPEHFGADRLIAVPLTRLFAAEGFADALSTAGDERLVLEAVEAQGVLDRPYDPPLPRRARQSSSFLLGARYGVVAFRSRPELDELRGWAQTSAHVDVAVLSGRGGVGKSRLARQLCADLAGEGWVTGVLAHDFDREAAACLARVDAALLVVIDYAETRAEDVVALLGLLARSRRPRRLVLIARQLGDWWTQLPGRSKDGEARELLGCALAIALGVAEKTVEARADAYAQALEAFARHTGLAADWAPLPDLSDRLFETLLFVHMAALGALPGAGATGVSGAIRGDLLERTLEREQHYWRDSARALDPPLEIDAHVRRRAVAVATLATPTTTGAPAGEVQVAGLTISRADYPTEKRSWSKPSPFWIEAGAAFSAIDAPDPVPERRRMTPQSSRAIADVTLSFSELKYAFECPYSFKLRFLYGFNPPIAEALGYGKGLHDALFEMHDRVLQGEEIDVDCVPELVERHVYLPFAYRDLRETLSAAAMRRLEAYIADRSATFTDIEHAERPIEIDLGDGIRVTGRIDLIRRRSTEGKTRCRQAAAASWIVTVWPRRSSWATSRLVARWGSRWAK